MSVSSRVSLKAPDPPDHAIRARLILVSYRRQFKLEDKPPFVPGDIQIRLASWFSMITCRSERPIPIPRALVREQWLKKPVNVGGINARSSVFDRHMHRIGLAQVGFYA